MTPPVSGTISPAIILRSVDLPEPFAADKTYTLAGLDIEVCMVKDQWAAKPY